MPDLQQAWDIGVDLPAGFALGAEARASWTDAAYLDRQFGLPNSGRRALGFSHSDSYSAGVEVGLSYPVGKRATGYGLLNLCACIVGGLSIYAGGYLRDRGINVVHMFEFAGFSLLFCILLLLFIRTDPARAEGNGVVPEKV